MHEGQQILLAQLFSTIGKTELAVLSEDHMKRKPDEENRTRRRKKGEQSRFSWNVRDEKHIDDQLVEGT